MARRRRKPTPSFSRRGGGGGGRECVISFDAKEGNVESSPVCLKVESDQRSIDGMLRYHTAKKGQRDIHTSCIQVTGN